MLFLPYLKSSEHLHRSRFKGFLSSQHVVKDTLMKTTEVVSLTSRSPPSPYAVKKTDDPAFLSQLG